MTFLPILPRLQSTERGDLKIRIQIDIPEKTSDEERKLYEQLRQFGKEQKNTGGNR